MGEPWADGRFEFAGVGHRHGLGGEKAVGASSAGGARYFGHFVHAPDCGLVQYQHGSQLLWSHLEFECFFGLGYGGQRRGAAKKPLKSEARLHKAHLFKIHKRFALAVFYLAKTAFKALPV